MCDDQGFIEQRTLEDGRHLGVDSLLFGRARLGISMAPPNHLIGIFADEWHFPSASSALRALHSWDGAGEPHGWERHLKTGRYRIGGGAHLEYIRGDGDCLAMSEQAIQITYGEDRRIIQYDLEESPGTSFPDGTTCARVVTESTICTHDPRCTWEYLVFNYLDRYVVLDVRVTELISVGNVIERLRGGH